MEDIRKKITRCLYRDRDNLTREYQRVNSSQHDALQKKVEAALTRKQSKIDALPSIVFPEILPVSAKREEIAAAIQNNQVIIVCGDTGSGKTTQIPKICLSLGRGIDGLIGHTQPRRIAARTIASRIAEELLHNVALRVEQGDEIDKFKVSGRCELHLGILIENMRREGFEVAVSRPEVVIRGEGDSREEPYEDLTIDIEEIHQGSIMEKMGERKGALQNMEPDGKGRIRLEYVIPSRGLIGFQTEFMTLTSGTGLLYHSFDHYGPLVKEEIGQRSSGVLVSNATGKALAFAIFNLQERGKMFIDHAQEVYEGQVVGIHSRDNDLVVNPLKAKQLNNIRAAGTDENLILVKPIRFTPEQALEFVDDDELVEITPESIRIRKKILNESMRKAATRGGVSK